MTDCWQCGASNAPDDLYCGECGSAQEVKVETSATVEPIAEPSSAEISCIACGETVPTEAQFCGNCGATQMHPAVGKQCPACHQRYADEETYCARDGTVLVTGVAPTSTAFMTEVPISRAAGGSFGQIMRAFFRRNLVLSVASLVAAVAWALALSERSEALKLLSVALSVALAAGWLVALTGPAGGFRFVLALDRWYARFLVPREGRERNSAQWAAAPITWTCGKWLAFADRNPDRRIAASLRMFGYALTIMALVCLAIVVVYIVLVLVVLAIGLWLLSLMSTDDDDEMEEEEEKRRHAARPRMMVGQRAREIYQGDGGLFGMGWDDKRVGRVDQDGQIYEGDGGLFGMGWDDKRVGKISEDGQIYEGDGGLFGMGWDDKRVGKVGKDGQIYEGDGGLFGMGWDDKRVGKIDKDGQIYEGDGGLFGMGWDDKRTGRSKPK